jgi:hypothetical protein
MRRPVRHIRRYSIAAREGRHKAGQSIFGGDISLQHEHRIIAIRSALIIFSRRNAVNSHGMRTIRPRRGHAGEFAFDIAFEIEAEAHKLLLHLDEAQGKPH